MIKPRYNECIVIELYSLKHELFKNGNVTKSKRIDKVIERDKKRFGNGDIDYKYCEIIGQIKADVNMAKQEAKKITSKIKDWKG